MYEEADKRMRERGGWGAAICVVSHMVVVYFPSLITIERERGNGVRERERWISIRCIALALVLFILLVFSLSQGDVLSPTRDERRGLPSPRHGGKPQPLPLLA